MQPALARPGLLLTHCGTTGCNERTCVRAQQGYPPTPVTPAPNQVLSAAPAATRATAALPRNLTFGARSSVRAAILAAAARDSAALQRVALDVPPGVDLERVLQK